MKHYQRRRGDGYQSETRLEILRYRAGKTQKPEEIE
jgi:hypothetical protein